ncbi:hypothetical protein I4U23_003684 [Adineta vaga]|nr:hypothetical protein I4U23_003684 [Adineta vaga]
MFFQVFAIVFLVNQLNIQVVAQEAVYECKAVTDPHVYTWRQKGSAQQPNQYQDCYMPSFVTLMEADSDNKCAQYGITWKATNAGTHYTMTVASNQTNFLSTIQFDGKSRQYTPHFNIHVWQPAHLALKSTGICTQFDQECQLKALPVDSELDDESIHPQARTITRSQAESICGVHVSTYLGKSRRAPHQRNANMNDTILNALTGCIEDLMFTGQPKAAESMVSVLMIEELTSDMTSIDSIQQVINTSIQEATAVLDEAIKEAQAEVPQLLGLSTTTAATTPLPTTTPRSTTTPLLTTTPRSTTTPLLTTTPRSTTAPLSTTTTSETMTTTVIPLASFKCSIYQDIYVQTWHPTNQATPPTRSCSGQSANFDSTLVITL